MKGDGGFYVFLLLGLVLIESSFARHLCPKKIDPCTCTVKTKGLVIICEGTNKDKILPVMNEFKKDHGVVINYITFRTNDMARLPDHIFMGMDIRHLVIMRTNLAVLESGSLTALATKMEILDLIQNAIEKIPTKALSPLTLTRQLTLPQNRITTVGPRSFEGMHSLERLSLYGNAITSVDENAFRGVDTTLLDLNLGGNKLQEIPTRAVTKLPNLTILQLQENQIKIIKESDFAGLSHLDSLKLAHNQITELGAHVFRSLPRMSSLDLEGNKIIRIDDKAFSGLEETLEWLKLGHNSIRMVPTLALKKMHKLREFDVKFNNITLLDEDAFEGFGNTIKYLHLENNQIDSLPMSVFSDMHSLETLAMGMNKIKHVPKDVFQPIIETVQVIDVHGNPLNCDCELLWYKRWIIRANTINADKVTHILLKTKCWSEKDRHEYMVNKAPLEQLYCPERGVGKGEVAQGSWLTILLTSLAMGSLVGNIRFPL